jgi:transposase
MIAGGPYPWAGELLEKKSYRLTSVALANKMARIVWAVLTSRQPYRVNYVKPASS